MPSKWPPKHIGHLRSKVKTGMHCPPPPSRKTMARKGSHPFAEMKQPRERRPPAAITKDAGTSLEERSSHRNPLAGELRDEGHGEQKPPQIRPAPILPTHSTITESSKKNSSDEDKLGGNQNPRRPHRREESNKPAAHAHPRTKEGAAGEQRLHSTTATASSQTRSPWELRQSKSFDRRHAYAVKKAV